MKSFPERPAEKLRLNKPTSAPWKDITMDFITSSQKLRAMILFLLCAAVTQNRHRLFLQPWKPQPEVLLHYLETTSGSFMACQKQLYQIEVHSLLPLGASHNKVTGNMLEISKLSQTIFTIFSLRKYTRNIVKI